MKRLLISFDDTDNLNTLGTGHALARFLETLPCQTSFITRHQLFVDERVPFTSHNSAMCATATGDIETGALIERASSFLECESAEGSDPGLCVAEADNLAEADLLVEWGRRAKVEVLAKRDAYELARRCNVHLSEHGGDGQGVVGALAAVGLRLYGDDGRVRGKRPVTCGRLTVADLLAQTGFDCVRTVDDAELPADNVVELDGAEVKAIFRNHVATVLVEPAGAAYRLVDKQALKRF